MRRNPQTNGRTNEWKGESDEGEDTHKPSSRGNTNNVNNTTDDVVPTRTYVMCKLVDSY